MAKNNNLTDFLTDLADGIRAKKGTTGTINPQNFRSEIESITTAKPTLNAPSISVSGTTLTITNPASNGSFVTSYTLYNGSTVITTTTSKTINLSTYITTAGTYTLTVKAKGTNFNDSASSNSVTYTLQSQTTTPVISKRHDNSNRYNR